MVSLRQLARVWLGGGVASYLVLQHNYSLSQATGFTHFLRQPGWRVCVCVCVCPCSLFYDKSLPLMILDVEETFTSFFSGSSYLLGQMIISKFRIIIWALDSVHEWLTTIDPCSYDDNLRPPVSSSRTVRGLFPLVSTLDIYNTSKNSIIYPSHLNVLYFVQFTYC